MIACRFDSPSQGGVTRWQQLPMRWSMSHRTIREMNRIRLGTGLNFQSLTSGYLGKRVYGQEKQMEIKNIRSTSRVICYHFSNRSWL